MPSPARRTLLVFLGAILAPGLILAGLALRSLQLQDAHLERERLRLLQSATDRLALSVATRLDELQREFSLRVDSLQGTDDAATLAAGFDVRLREHWELAEIGFAVTLNGQLHAPQPQQTPSSLDFVTRNLSFLCQSAAAQVFANQAKGQIVLPSKQGPVLSGLSPANALPTPPTASPVRFRDLVGEAQEGVLSRFLDDQLVVWVWRRSARDPDLVFGAQLAPRALRELLSTLVRETPAPAPGITLGLLNERGTPIHGSRPTPPPAADWAHPLAASFIGPSLPLWRIAAGTHDPRLALAEQHRSRLVLATIVVLLVVALAFGGWTVMADARRQLAVARQKSDFVSNVSHELRTPLTSIRLSAELLAENRVRDPARQAQHLRVIQTEATRLQRLINNVLDFARTERAERTYRREPLDLNRLAHEVFESFEPQFQSLHFAATLEPWPHPLPLETDPDAVAQIVHNLVANALKYAATGAVLELRVRAESGAACIEVLDRGPGIPAGLEERVFEPFFRAEDSLTQTVSGTGIGLTLARQIARDLGGDVHYQPRPDGGSHFLLRLPLPDALPRTASAADPIP